MAITEAPSTIASVTGLWRYPVKSMQGEELNAAEVTERGFIEDSWIGRTLVIGEARIAVQKPCPLCVMTTLPQGDLPRDGGVLRTAAKFHEVNVGVYCAVQRGGTIRRGGRSSHRMTSYGTHTHIDSA